MSATSNLEEFIRAANILLDHYGKDNIKVNLSHSCMFTLNGNRYVDMLSQIGDEIKTVTVNMETGEIREGPVRIKVQQ